MEHTVPGYQSALGLVFVQGWKALECEVVFC